MNKDPKDIVEEGYDRIASQYNASRDPVDNENELNEFMSFMRPGCRILDAGCGTGVIARILVDNGFQVTGIDLSQKMVDIAKDRTPEAQFIVGDMTALDFDDASFDGIVSTYALFHVPRTKHMSLFRDFHRILKKGGLILFSIGSNETEGTDGVWLWDEFQSVQMFWSYYPPSKTVKLLESANFEILFARNAEIIFGEDIETHFWILAKAK